MPVLRRAFDHGLRHRTFAVIILPLVILANFSGPGGWHCADGSLCRPATALTCCCGPAVPQPALDECCSEEPGSERSASVSTLPCGCYYHAHGGEALSQEVVQHAPSALPPANDVPFVGPPATGSALLLTVVPISAPRYLVSPAGSRAPPIG